MKEMSWLWRNPTAIALFHRFTRLWPRRMRSNPSSVKPVFSTAGQGAPNRQGFRLCRPSMAYLTDVGLCVCTCVAPAQKFASSSNDAAN
jgi:hypothetical protein